MNAGLTSIILVMGFFVSVLLNVAVNIWGTLLKSYKKSLKEIPRWLIYANGGFLIVQVILLLK